MAFTSASMSTSTDAISMAPCTSKPATTAVGPPASCSSEPFPLPFLLSSPFSPASSLALVREWP
eukprot:7736489-Karenia_brevis.AAC.1